MRNRNVTIEDIRRRATIMTVGWQEHQRVARKRLMREQDYELLEAETGQEGIFLIQQHSLDLESLLWDP